MDRNLSDFELYHILIDDDISKEKKIKILKEQIELTSCRLTRMKKWLKIATESLEKE